MIFILGINIGYILSVTTQKHGGRSLVGNYHEVMVH